MSKLNIKAGLACISLLLAGQPDLATAAMLNNDKEVGWASRRNLTSQQFSQAFSQYSDSGMMMIDVEAYPSGRGVRYSMIWRTNPDGRQWAEHRDMTSEAYQDKWTEYQRRGFRPLDVETYEINGSRRWAGIWVENKEGLNWSSHRGLDSNTYGELFEEKSAAGFRLIDIEVYETSDGLRFATIWLENKSRIAWAQLRGMTRENYQEEVNSRSANGFRVVDFESYSTPNGRRYAAIWEHKPGFAWQTRTDRTEAQFSNLWRQYRDEGYRLVDLDAYQTEQGVRYAGIWAENNARYHHAHKNWLDQTMNQYRDVNNLPGISIAIIKDGDLIYSRGFGFADVARNRVAHSETVYGLASVSKVIGGTLAAKLEDEDRLRNGSIFSLDLTQPTSTYLTNIQQGGGTFNLPSFHTHKAEHLFSHLSCIPHYPQNTAPGISNQTGHYSSAVSAMRSFWNTGLVTDVNVGNNNPNQPCTVGGSSSYSTPAFTFGAAVLERVTGRTIFQLLENELFKPYVLDSMRVQFASANLPANYERATPYDRSNNPTSYSDNSWKVLGGGIESNAVDLARFGWKTLNGEIVKPAARDARLWTRVAPASSASLGWFNSSLDRRRVASHTGSWTGARSMIRVFPDDGLVIAVLSNRTGHSQGGDLSSLTRAIAAVVLAD